MKKKVVENLKALIDNCAEKEQLLVEKQFVKKIYKNKKSTWREMSMIA